MLSAAKKLVITDSEVEHILALRETKEALKKRLALVEDSLEAAENDLIALLDSGAEVDSRHSLRIKEVSKRFPAWRDHYLDLAGKEAAHQVLQSTPAKTYRNLIVE